jgi:hypothetical protein
MAQAVPKGKEGAVSDPYRIFAQAVMSGQFNDIFASSKEVVLFHRVRR